MKWFLKPQGAPVDRDLFIHTDKYLGSASTTTFSLHTLMPWSNLAGLRSGLRSGKTSLLTPGVVCLPGSAYPGLSWTVQIKVR